MLSYSELSLKLSRNGSNQRYVYVYSLYCTCVHSGTSILDSLGAAKSALINGGVLISGVVLCTYSSLVVAIA